MLASLFTMEQVLPWAVFGLFSAGAWWLIDLLAAGRSRVVDRLEELRHPAKRRRGKDGLPVRKTDAMAELLEKATPALAKPLQPKSEKEVGALKARLSAAGFRNETAPSVFLGLKFLLLCCGLFLAGGSSLILGGFTQKSLMSAVMISGLMFYLPDVVVWFIARKRKEEIFLGLPDALDLMVVCVEAGLGLDQAMRKVADEMKKAYRVLAEEFQLCNMQLQMGRTRAEVLHELGSRTGVDDLRALAAVLIQADKFGGSVGQALRTQSDSMRTRRRQLAEERAAKTAVKLIFPLVIFIFPGIFVVLVGPAAITMVREMFPVMNGSGS